MADYGDLARYQDQALGQLPMLQVYSHILYFFPMPHGSSREQIIHDLEAAVTKVRTDVPWMGARVVNIGKAEGNSGIYRPISCQLPKQAIDIADFTDEIPEYTTLHAQKAPLSLIDTEKLTPVPGFPKKFEDSDENPAHVVRLQVSFIRRGVVVDFAFEHNMGDASGHFGFVKLVAIAMRGEDFPPSFHKVASRDRRNIISLLGPNEPMLDHSHHKRPPVTDAAPFIPRRDARYHVFRFTVENMNKLKRIASQREGFDPDVPFISTDDAICAFCWKHFIIARKDRFPADTTSRYARQIDGRKLIGLPPEYMGEVAHTMSAWMTFQQLAEAPLSTIASYLRKRLNETNNLYHLRSFATFIAREPDKSTITYSGKFNPDVDIGCSSIRTLDGVFPDFGRLGRPKFIRRPPSVPFPSTLVLYPGSPDGDCDAIGCLTDADFEAISANPEWNKYVEHIG
ncbi:transferase family-domain-containing protein [Hypoxylon trugodes]|uniref:transferase family-domain-containing protein n=1 Tax=Hypoxylon trugodes TaxID=326681 RepID=UPI002194A5AF|nr:transferase family-domain-containing protein [Hypoxylon trugodes]KAI1386653.1 transferase family-domain-containing protein [Hypoxylon trugodes]